MPAIPSTPGPGAARPGVIWPWQRRATLRMARHQILGELRIPEPRRAPELRNPGVRTKVYSHDWNGAQTLVLRGPVRIQAIEDRAPIPGRAGPLIAERAALKGASHGSTLESRLLVALQPPLELLISTSGPLEWPADLMAFQIEGLHLLLERDALLLADEMGLGKTVQALAAIRLLTLAGKISSCLVVVPASIFGQWREQFERWAPELRLASIRGSLHERPAQWRMPAHAHLVSYETLRADAQASREQIWDLVVIDEAQRIKNSGADVSTAVKQVLRRRAWALTGTPLENRLEDLASILEFTRPRHPDSISTIIRPGQELRDHLNDIQLRRRKREVLPQLPPKLFSDVLLDMGEAQRRAYNRAENEGLIHLKSLGTTVTITHVLELILRLKQICNFDPESGGSVKADDLEERLDSLEATGERALVFTQYTDDQFGAAAIAKRIERMKPIVYTGAIAPDERDRLVQQFKRDHDRRVMVLSLRAGGQGLNLQDASYVFHFDRWWNPAVENQATDRSHRLGQDRTVNVYAYTIENSIEERIRDILVQKQVLFDSIVEGAGIDVGRTFTKEQIFAAVGLQPPQRSDPPSASDPLGFEREVGHLLELSGYSVEFTPESHDGGIDIVATRTEAAGLAGSVLYVQCKSSDHPVGVAEVRQLLGSLPPFAPGVGVVASAGGFSQEAAELARLRGVRLWGPAELSKLRQT